MRKDLDAFFKATERWHLTSAERRALLGVCASDSREVALWFRTRKPVAPFSGRTPLALLFREMTGFKAVAEYLTEWRGRGTEF